MATHPPYARPAPPANRRTTAKAAARVLALGAAVATVVIASPASAACRVTDFTDRSLSSLSEIQRLAFASQMTSTEFEVLKQAPVGGEDHYPLLADSANVTEARQSAAQRIENLGIDNSADYARFWALDYLTDRQLLDFVACSSRRRPGQVFAGRPDGAARFNLAFAHYTPIGVEPIRLQVVASHNIANIAAFERYLSDLGEQENFTERLFALRLSDRSRRAVLVMRAGWETPVFVYIPPYPAPDVR